MRRGWRIGRLGTIPLYLDPSLVLVFGLVAWTLASAYLPARLPGLSPSWRWTAALLTALLFFASVLAHELAHSAMAHTRKVPVLGITLSFFGGVAWLGDEPATPFDEILITAVGPLASLVIGGLTLMVYVTTVFVLQILTPAGDLRQWLGALAVSTWYLGEINVLLAIFNLLPTFPLDGGRLLHALLWALSGRTDQALVWSVRIGQGVAGLLVIASLLLSLWMRDGMLVVWGLLLAWVLYRTARESLVRYRLRQRLANVAVDSLMERNFPRVPPHLTLDVLADQLLARHHRVALIPVTNGTHLLGVVIPAAVERVPQIRRPSTTAAAIMRPAHALPHLAPDDDADRALRLMASVELAALPVMRPATGATPTELVGLLDQRTLITLLHTPSR